MHPRKVLVAGISTTLALILAWLILDPARYGRRLASTAQGGLALRSVDAAARSRRSSAASSASSAHALSASDEALLRAYFEHQLERGFQFDPLAYLVRVPDVKSRWTWPEHPSGVLKMNVNREGFREDKATPLVFPGPRVIVSGDSHTDGLVENRNSFANVAERALRARMRQEIDVVNAGVGYTSPSCYRGMLERCLPMRPDVFVAVLFNGNDFLDELGIASALRRRETAPYPEGYWERSNEVAEQFPGFNQGLCQAFRFASFPGEADSAVSLVLEVVLAMDELCRAEGISFLLVLLPTKMDVDEDDRETWTKFYGQLGLDADHPARELELGRRVLAGAREHGIDCLDPTEAMRSAQVPLYWKRDYHLGLEGHARLGSLLAGRLHEILADRQARRRLR